MFKVRNTLFKTNLSPKLCLHIYDTLVRPISTYCSEVWGVFTKNISKMFQLSNEKYQLFDEACFEKTDLKFSKSILGVNRMACNAAVRGELGRHPMIIYVIKQILKNWVRIVDYDRASVLHDAYLCNWNLTMQNKTGWLSKIKDLVCDTLKMKHVWENQGGENNFKQVNTVITNVRYIYQFHWSNEINRKNNNGKPGKGLRTYALCKKTFEYENYLDFHTDFKKRRLITKIRISAHKLEIETGRYQGKTHKRKKPEERLCKHCD